MENKINKTPLFEDLASSIERFVHQDSDRQLLHKILAHTVALNCENDQLRHENETLVIENARLSGYKDAVSERYRNRQITTNGI